MCQNQQSQGANSTNTIPFLSPELTDQNHNRFQIHQEQWRTQRNPRTFQSSNSAKIHNNFEEFNTVLSNPLQDYHHRTVCFAIQCEFIAKSDELQHDHEGLRRRRIEEELNQSRERRRFTDLFSVAKVLKAYQNNQERTQDPFVRISKQIQVNTWKPSRSHSYSSSKA
jgi:hypothetical protein